MKKLGSRSAENFSIDFWNIRYYNKFNIANVLVFLWLNTLISSWRRAMLYLWQIRFIYEDNVTRAFQ